MKNLKYFIILIISVLVLIRVNTQVVCSLDELVKELYEDLIDNGKLDCLRKSTSPNEDSESEERKMRLDANWDSDCSFEAEGQDTADWRLKFREVFKLSKGLVDVNGDPVTEDFDDQADMCEIIRALVANGKIPPIGEDVKSISLEILDYIDCPGNDSQTQVCAATGGSFSEKLKWYILLDGQSIKINNEPKYIIDNK